MANTVVDPALLQRLRAVTGCMQDPNFTCRHYRAVDDAPDCDDCLTLLAAAVEEQTIARCAAACDSVYNQCYGEEDTSQADQCGEAVRSLPRQWSEK